MSSNSCAAAAPIAERHVVEGMARCAARGAAQRKAGRWLALIAGPPLIAAALLWWNVPPAPQGPRAAVNGGDGGGLPRATPVEEHFDTRALDLAAAYADSLQAHAFVVMRHNHIVVERYGRGFDRNTLADAGGFSAALAALAAGIAESHGQISMQDIANGDLTRLVMAIEMTSRQRYADYLSQNIWSRANAAPAWIALPSPRAATPPDCCFHARITDWMRIASLLLDDGNFEGERLIPAGWVEQMRMPRSRSGEQGLGVWRASAAHGAAAFAADDVFYLRGLQRWRLWLAPALELAVLLAADESASAPVWDETRLPNLVMRALTDQPARSDSEAGLKQLVPGH